MLKATDIMTPQVITIRSAAMVQDAIRLMQTHRLHALIVNRRHDQDAFGIVTDHDIMTKAIAMGRNPQDMRVLEIMTKPCIAINPDLGIDYVTRLLVSHNIRQAPVIQTDLLGIISFEDIIRHSQTIVTTEMQFEEAIEGAIQEAKDICEDMGASAKVCAEAWKAVEELQAEVAYLCLERLERTAYDHYCDDYPEAIDVKEYDAWCSG